MSTTMNNFNKGIILSTALLFFIFASVSFAQNVSTTGTIQGTISSADTEALPGVKVIVTNLDTGLIRETFTNDKGYYAARLLPLSNNYQIEASLEGFNTMKQTGVKVSIGSVLNIDLTMQLASVEEVIVVTSDAAIVEVGKSEFTTTISEEAIQSLPLNGRDYTDFVQLTPMVTVSTEREGLSISGARGINSNIMMDGADNNSAFFGEQRGGTRPPFTFSQEAVKEFQVINNGFSAQYGKAGGGIVNAVTKSGTNTYHSSLWYYFRDDSFVGEDANGETLDTFDQKQLGLTFSGPIIKDKLFFFLCYDSQRYDTTNFFYSDAEQDQFFMGLDGQAWTQTNDQDVFLLKLDYQLNPENNLSFRWNYLKHESDNGTGGSGYYYAGDAMIDIDGTMYPISNNGLEKDTANSMVIQWNSFLSATMFNEFRFQYAHEDRPREAKSTALPETAIYGVATFGQNNFLPNGLDEDRYQFLENFTYSMENHEINVGIDFNYLVIDDWFPRYASGSYTFYNEDAWINRNDPEYVADNNYDYKYTQSFGTFDVDYEHFDYAFYVQDEWKPMTNLTINGGLRYDFQSHPDPEETNPLYPDTGQIPEDSDNWAPRLGFSWDPTGDNKMNVRGGVGIFYSRTPSLLVANALLNNGVTSSRYEVRPNDPNFPDYPNTMTAEPTGGASKPTLFVFDPDFENPETLRFSLGVEREIIPDLAVSIDYTYAKTENLERRFNANLKPSTETAEDGRPLYDDYDVYNENFYKIITFKSDAESEYNAFNLKMNKRMSNNWSMLASYTYAENKDNDSNERSVSSSSGYSQDQYDLDGDWGWANFDVRHQLAFSGLYELPYGFAVSGIFRYNSGQPWTITTGDDDNNDGFYSDRPIGVARNSERRPEFKTFDFRLSWSFKFYQEHEITIIGEAFNLFDWENRDISGSHMDLDSSQFGVEDLAGDPRQFQVGLRYSF